MSKSESYSNRDMEHEQNLDFKELSLQMRKGLVRIRCLRKLFRVLTITVYLSALAWFGFCIFGGFLIDRADYETSMNTSKYIMIGFLVFCVLHFAFMKVFSILSRQENEMMTDIIAKLFPDAMYMPSGSADSRLLAESRLFGTPISPDSPIAWTGYGRLDIPTSDGIVSIADVGVTSANRKDFSSMAFLEILYQSLVRPIFGVRVESTIHDFRGMFGCCKLNRTFRGYVMLLPDHLENKLGYLAQTIQGMKEKHGAKFVHLEDSEFEKLFAVYADDEMEARMVLTPAMMRRLTSLRQSFKRDLMISFKENMFYYASDTPDGFLRPGRKSLNDERLLEQLHREINFCLAVKMDMK